MSGPLVAPGELRTVADLASLGADSRAGDLEIDLHEVNVTPFISAQNEYNLLDRRIEAELVP
ncbi:MAG: aldo/keto reductase, partial [Dehalococcoidia bacterium]|nr:aldo/keto reductase [Dehalococcoidia bacterium]